MPVPEMTVFEQTMHAYSEWDGVGEPPAWPLYIGAYAVALVDIRPKLIGQVVVFPPEGYPGEDKCLADLPLSKRLSIDAATHIISGKMRGAFESERPIEHVEGFAVPDHPHRVLFPAVRGKSVRLHEAGLLDIPRGYFQGMQKLLRLTERETRLLDNQIATLVLNATLLDAT